ncbi:MAG: hypothetical protein MJ196_06000 [Treponemataceae bacterium]|nr:hypothetical protein [Treponemataceae bacterium]
MNRRAKRNKYKKVVRNFQNKLNEFKAIFDRTKKIGKEVEIEILTCAIPVTTEAEYFPVISKEKLKAEQERIVLDHFSRLLMERPDLLKKENCGSYYRFMMKVVKE